MAGIVDQVAKQENRKKALLWKDNFGSETNDLKESLNLAKVFLIFFRNLF